MQLRRSVLGCVCVLVVGTGCQEVTSSDTAPLTLTVSSSDTPLEGVELCPTTGPGDCEYSDESGRVTIMLPVGEETSFTIEKEGFARYLEPVVLPATGVVETKNILRDEDVEEQHDRLMSPYPNEEAGNVFLGTLPRREGVTFELVGATGKRYYKDEEFNWRSDLTSTTADGSGGFVEVIPAGTDGVAEARLSGNAEGCFVDPANGWPGDPDGRSVRFPVRPGYRTTVRWACSVQ